VLSIYGPLLSLVVALVAASLVFVVWVANRKRIAAKPSDARRAGASDAQGR
jgi:hypothetical protein